MYMICADHLSMLSMMTPRNFVSFTSCILIWFITISSIQWEKFFGVNNIKLVISIFKDNLLAFTKSKILNISSLTSRILSLRSVPVQNRLVSSAKSIGIKKLDTFVKSLIYKRKSKGPSIDPCGTPQLITLSSDWYPLCATDCWRFDE